MEMSPTSPITRAPSRAALYVRMSTEHQQYSPQNQADVIRQYAADHNMDIVREYSDHGRSGLNIAGRDGLNQLMSDGRPHWSIDSSRPPPASTLHNAVFFDGDRLADFDRGRWVKDPYEAHFP